MFDEFWMIDVRVAVALDRVHQVILAALVGIGRVGFVPLTERGFFDVKVVEGEVGGPSAVVARVKVEDGAGDVALRSIMGFEDGAAHVVLADLARWGAVGCAGGPGGGLDDAEWEVATATVGVDI